LDSLGRTFDHFPAAVVPQWLSAVLGHVEVREQVCVNEVQRELVEPVAAREAPDRPVVRVGIEPVDLLSDPAPTMRPLHCLGLLAGQVTYRSAWQPRRKTDIGLRVQLPRAVL